MCRSLMLVLLGLLVGGSAFAVEAEEPSVMMDEVVVTATRLVESTYSVPANVTVITEEEIDQSAAQNVPELLRAVPGVLVNDIAGNGRNYTVDLRGFGETASLNTLVLVDGRRINQADLSGVDWVLIPKERVERIEIVRGSRGGVLYGDNAAGGVVNIITKKGGEELTGSIGAYGGSYETFQSSAFLSAGVDEFSVGVNGNYLTSDGYRDNSDTLAKDVGATLDYEAFDRLPLRFSAGYHEDETGQPAALFKSQLDSGVSRKSTNAPDDEVETKDWYFQGAGQYFLSDNNYVDVDTSFRRREADFSYISIGIVGKTEIDTVSVSPKLVINEILLGFGTKLLFGIDYQDDDEDLYSDSSYYGINSQDASKESYGYYVHADVELSDNLSISGGARKEKVEFDFVDGSESYDKTINEDLFVLGATYQFNPKTSAYISYAKSFRSPLIDEFYDFYENAFDPTLDAQTSYDLEAGLRLTLTKDTAVGVNLFHLITENELYYNPAGGPLGWGANENLDGDSIRQGLELSFKTKLYDILINGGYTFRDTEIDGGQYDGKEMPNVPKHQVTFGLNKVFSERIQLGLNGTYIGERRYISDFDNDKGHLEDYFYMTSQLSYLMDSGRAYLAVNNLLNEEYSEYGVDYGNSFLDDSPILGLYPSPKINFIVGVDFRF